MNYRTMPCPICGKTSVVALEEVAYQKWLGGSYVQDAFPDLPEGVREMLLTGIHPPCWDATFPEEVTA